MTLSLGYVTSRKQPRFEWFSDSIHNQLNGDYTDIRIIVCDFYAQAHEDWTNSDAIQRRIDFRKLCQCPLLTHVPPKPTVWQGMYRLTRDNFFAAANARNTVLCHAQDGHIAFVDDLSVLAPTWIGAVREAMTGKYIACGAYKKVKNMVVENGTVKSFADGTGNDSRWHRGMSNRAVPCRPNDLFGCSLVAPVEAFLKVNGYPEMCDGMGYEDCITGSVIAKHGYHFKYDRRMLTYESEEDHNVGAVMRREDPGRSPADKSHKMQKMLSGVKRFENEFGDGFKDLIGLRKHILNGGSFPVRTTPQTEWFTGKPLAEFP